MAVILWLGLWLLSIVPTFSAEQILFANHTTGGAYLLSAADGSILATIPGSISNFPSDIWGTASPSVLAGHMNRPGTDPGGDGISLFDYSFNQIAATQWGAFTGHTFPVGVDHSGNFYLANDQRLQGTGGRGHTVPPLVVVRKYSPLGVQLDEWTLPFVTISGMAVSREGGILYYAEDSESLMGTAPDLSPLHRYNLAGDVPMSDLIGGGGDSRWGIDWFMSTANELFATWSPNRFPAGNAEDWIVRRIDRITGDIITTYAAPLPPFDGFDVSIRPDLTDASAFWMWTQHFSPNEVTLTKFDIETADVLRQFTVNNATLHGADTWWAQSGRDTVAPGVVGTIGPILWWRFRRRAP